MFIPFLVFLFSDSSHVHLVNCHALMSYTINSALFLYLSQPSLLCFCQIAVFVPPFQNSPCVSPASSLLPLIRLTLRVSTLFNDL